MTKTNATMAGAVPRFRRLQRPGPKRSIRAFALLTILVAMVAPHASLVAQSSDERETDASASHQWLDPQEARNRLFDLIKSADDGDFVAMLQAAQCAVPTVTDPREARSRLRELMDDSEIDLVAVYDHVLNSRERWPMLALVDSLNRELEAVTRAAWGDPPPSVCEMWERMAEACWERYERCQRVNPHSRRPCQNIREECEGWDEDLESCSGGDDECDEEEEDEDCDDEWPPNY